MSVSTKHPLYQAYESTWEDLRNAYTGSGAVKPARDVLSKQVQGVKMAGTRYLLKPPGQTDEQYAAYVSRARWLNATEHAVHGLSGGAFRREPVIEVPVALESQLDDVTQTGLSLRTYAEQAMQETVLMARHGTLIDFPKPERLPSGDTVAPPMTSRPYWVAYRTEEILNWRTTQRQGDTILSLVVLRECLPIVQGPWGSDAFFETRDQVQYRVLRLDEEGRYEVSLWIEQPLSALTRDVHITLRDVWIPLRHNEPLTFIPFYAEPITKSILEGLVEINYQNYRHSADKEQGLHLAAGMTPYICSDSPKPDDELTHGTNVAWWVTPSSAHVGALTFTNSLQPHEQAMADDMKEMAMLVARTMDPGPIVQETATAALARTAGADSPMQALIRRVSHLLTQALRTHAWWAGVTDNPMDPAIHMTLNTDLVATRMEPQMLIALNQALLQHTMSYETYWYNLQQGEIARPQIDAEEEQELIALRQESAPLAPVVLTGRNGAVAR